MKGVVIAAVVVIGLAVIGWKFGHVKQLPDVPIAPAVSQEDSKTVKTRRLEVIDESDGSVGMVFTVEKGTSYITVNDGGKQRKVDLTKLARRL